MRRTLVIQEEFGIFHVETSTGVKTAGRSLVGTLRAATRATGVAARLREGARWDEAREPDLFLHTADLFFLLCPQRPPNDGPVAA